MMAIKGVYNRITLAGIVALLFFVTMATVSMFPFRSWQAFAFGILVSSFGSALVFLILRQWEENLKKREFRTALPLSSVPLRQTSDTDPSFHQLEAALDESRARQQSLVNELNEKAEFIHKLEQQQQQYAHKVEDVAHELNAHRSNSDEELRRKTVLLTEYQETINQQRDVIKKKQDQIVELESKVSDLNYEVKTLLQLAEIGTKQTPHEHGMVVTESTGTYQIFEDKLEKQHVRPPNNLVKTPEEASQQLKRCIDIAQKITSGNRFANGNSRFKDIPIDNYALDLRRLFDNLRSENSSTILVFSQKDNRILFANQHISNLLGWNPEKFINNFSEIIQESLQDWNKGIGQLSSSPESKVRMVMKTKSGQNLLTHCHLSIIPSGVFRNHVIGVLYPA